MQVSKNQDKNRGHVSTRYSGLIRAMTTNYNHFLLFLSKLGPEATQMTIVRKEPLIQVLLR